MVLFYGWLSISFNSLSWQIYILWLVVFILSSLFAFSYLPVELKLHKAIKEAITDLRHYDAERLIEKAYQGFFLLPSFRVKLACLDALFYRKNGEFLQAYKILQALKILPLLPYERRAIDVEMMLLLFDSGNYKATRQALERLQKGKLSKEEQFKCHQIQANLYLMTSDYQVAKDLIEDLLFNTQMTPNIRVKLLHTLAVAETYQQNYQSAMSAYRKAWAIQRDLKNNFSQAEITIDNLIQTYAKQDEVANIQLFFQQLERLADPDNINHLLALNNIKLNLARQLGDREALLATYQQTNDKLLPKLDGELRFAYLVNSLRMHWNDGVNFDAALKEVMGAMLHRPNISTLKNLRSIKEVIGTLAQAMETIGPRPDLRVFYSWLILEFKRLEPEIDQLLDDISPNLPTLKSELIGFKINAIKYSFSYQTPSEVLFNRLFGLLSEKRNLWQGMHNTAAQLNEVVGVLDEYNAYEYQLKVNKSDLYPFFVQKFKPMALAALDDAEQLIAPHQQHGAYANKLIALAYACYRLDTKKVQAKQWIEAFNEMELSLEHSAVWLREQYRQAKAWVSN